MSNTKNTHEEDRTPDKVHDNDAHKFSELDNQNTQGKEAMDEVKRVQSTPKIPKENSENPLDYSNRTRTEYDKYNARIEELKHRPRTPEEDKELQEYEAKLRKGEL